MKEKTEKQAGCTLAGVICMELKKMSSIFNSYPIWHLTFLHKMTVCGILCMWVVFFSSLFRQVCICCLLSSPFVIHLAINLRGEKDCWDNIYFHLGKDHIFWIHFEFSSSDGKLVKFCIEPQMWKIVTKFTLPFLCRDHTWEAKLLLWNTSLLNWIPRTVVQRCRQGFSHSKEMFNGLLHFVLPQPLYEYDSFTSVGKVLGC